MVYGMPTFAAARVAARISSAADMVSIQTTSAPPCLKALDLLDEHLDCLVLAERPKRGEDIAGRTHRSRDDDATARCAGDRTGVLSGEPVELRGAGLEPVQREAPAIAAKTVGQDDVRARVYEGLVQGLDPVGVGGVPKLGRLASSEAHREQIGAGGAIRQ